MTPLSPLPPSCQAKDLKAFQSSQKVEERQVSRDVKDEVERTLPKVEQKQALRRKLSDIQGLQAEKVSVLSLSLSFSVVCVCVCLCM